ncbi:MAG: glucose-6-phosphate isomerase [Deltaproteobacteria bacterium]|jgi:glucose-6-phosphate isomerase|nr:glucose-6-phosphate isomerase [Deltaproteobacteria bacterium]
MANKVTKKKPASVATEPKPICSSPLALDYNNLTSKALGSTGLTTSDLNTIDKELAKATKDFFDRRKKGELPFADLPTDPDIPKQCLKFAKKNRKKFQTVVVLGIGGSALGAKAVYTAIEPKWNRSSKKAWPKLIVTDNIDPEGFSAVLDELDLSTTCFNVISKSGATAETMTQFMLAHERLQKKLGRGKAREHLLVTTDSQNGVLRKLVNSNGYMSFPIPAGVGGRFSVLTAVGLAPLAMAGVDITELLNGARIAQDDFNKPGNIAALFAGLNWLLTTGKKRGSLVMMPYSDALSKVSDWFAQLWNESLGKAHHADGREIGSVKTAREASSDWYGQLLKGAGNAVKEDFHSGTGQTAIKALGVTDQHSQLQLYMEGPQDKTVCFLGVESFRVDVTVPSIFGEHQELQYLGGHTLGEILNFERLGTARALAENGRPNLSLTMPIVSPSSVGYLLQTLMLATVVSGALAGINALDQPGVELSKKFTYGLIGREGFSEMSERYNKKLVADRKYIVEAGE